MKNVYNIIITMNMVLQSEPENSTDIDPWAGLSYTIDIETG